MTKTLKKLIEKHIITVTVEKIDFKALGAEAREMRKAKNKSLREVAKKLDISAPYLSDMERGNRNFQLHILEKYLKLIK